MRLLSASRSSQTIVFAEPAESSSAEGRKFIEQLLDLRLQFGILELDDDSRRRRPLHRFGRDFLLHQQILYGHDRSIDGDLHRPIFVHFHDHVNAALQDPSPA